VRRDLHKMHAFVRFRKVLEPGDQAPRPVVVDELLPADPNPQAHHLVLETPTPFGPVKSEIEACEPPEPIPDEQCEHFIAWYQPDHRILRLAAPFFAERFAIMRWTILTPDASVSWDPVAKQLNFAAGVPREKAPAEDELETLWRAYYASIYNPARLNPQAMKSEMPVRYWKNLPEVAMLPALITQSRTRVASMVTRQQSQPSAAPFLPEDRSLPSLVSAMPACRGCELYCHATQVVPGRGPGDAELMLVGEQPGDKEDLRGEPFVGPAGTVLNELLEELRIPRLQVFVTNAVKHFKYIQRGKLRLHQNPRMSEITACRPWLLAEIAAVKPKVILCLGASASKSLLGGTFALMKDHGKLVDSPYAAKVLATIHPSAVLRGRDEQNRRQLREFLATDLAKAWEARS
jgi:DNA polymerase